MRAYEFIAEASFQVIRHGTWDIAVSDDPIKSPQTGDTPKYVARAVNTRGQGPRKGDVKVAYAMTQNGAVEAVQDMVLDISRASINPDDYRTFTVDLNVNFTKEYIDPRQGNYFKLDRDEAGQPILVMASKEYYQTFGDELEDLGFLVVRNRIVKQEGSSTPVYGFGVGPNKVKRLGLVPNMRYVTDYVHDDADGNAVFRLIPHSRYTGTGKMRMGEPGFILAATPNDPTTADAGKKRRPETNP